MAAVMIKCPETGDAVNTGLDLDEETWQSKEIEDNVVGPCPHCGEQHRWSKQDAWLAGPIVEG